MNDLLPEADKERIYQRLLALNADHFSLVASGPEHIRQMTRDSLDESRSRAQLELFQEHTGKSLRGLDVLEIGAGIGLTVAVARILYGAEAVGIEPGGDEYEGTPTLARAVMTACGLDPDVIHGGSGEVLPFDDSSFDAVISSNVLEHVDDPPLVIAETLRVLRPGGHIHFVVPNYGSWWEGHYGFLWFPHMPAAVAKGYVWLRGRDPEYIDTLQLVSQGRLLRWLRPHAADLQITGLGKALWEKRIRTLDFAEYAALGKLKTMVELLHRLGLIELSIYLGRRLNWQTPIVLTAVKRGDQAA